MITDIAIGARPLSRAHAKTSCATNMPEVWDVHDCDFETRDQTDLRMSALRARRDAPSRGEVAQASDGASDGVWLAPPSERNRPFRVDEHGRGYRKAYGVGSCRGVVQHRGVDRMSQRRTCRAVDASWFDGFCWRESPPAPWSSPRACGAVIGRALARPVGSKTPGFAAYSRSSPAVNEVPMALI